jgi:hydroxymethylglutaryl-CoA lyase
LATDDLLYMLDGMGIATGVQMERLAKAALFIEEKIGRKLNSHYLQTLNESECQLR